MSDSATLLVGAGPAGLAAARALRDQGLDVDHVEANGDVGGLWDIDAPGTPMYESAHLISSRTTSAFPGYPMPADYPDYPSHRLVLEYLRSFADHHDLTGSIEFHTRAADLRPGPRGWTVTLTGPDGLARDRDYRDVVLCTGPMHTPFIPELPGHFAGELMHSIDYREPGIFAGRRVLVVGAGNSGCDIACDASRTAEAVHLSMRRGYWFLPTHLFGRPVDTLSASGPRLPRVVEQRALQAWLRLTEGDLRRLGVPKPDHRLFETHPIVNSVLLHHLRHGDVTVRPGIADIDGRTVGFTDGSSVEVDVICLCTGYRHTIPVAGDLIPGDRMPDLYLSTFSREHRGLAAIGFFETNSGAYRLYDGCARMVAGHIADRDRDPQAHRRFAERLGRRPDLSGGLRFDASPRHQGYVDSHAFTTAVRLTVEEFGWDPVTTGARG